MVENGDFRLDMEAAWETAKILQEDSGELERGRTVVVYGDEYSYEFIEIDPATGLAHVSRPGDLSLGEPSQVEMHFDPADVVHIDRMDKAMMLNCNRVAELVNGYEDSKARLEQ